MSVLQALLLSDGRKGHTQLADGIAEAVSRLRPVSLVRLQVERGRWPGRLLATVSNTGFGDAYLLRRVYEIDQASLPAAQLVISAGAKTLAANVACTRLLKSANIFYGSLRAFRPQSFDLVLTSYLAQATRPRHAFALKPSRVAADVRRSNPPLQSLIPPRVAGLLIGGPSGECVFDATDWDGLIQALTGISAQYGTQWRVTNSPRTPAGVSDRLAAMTANGDPTIQCFVDIRQPSGVDLSTLLIGCDAVVITDDSSSMISEVVASGLPALGVKPAQQTLTENEYGYRQSLMDPGWYRSISIAACSPTRFVQELSHIRTLATDPIEGLASLIAQRLPALFSQSSN